MGLGGKPEGYVGTTAVKRGDVEATARESLPEPVRSRVLAGESVNSLERASTCWRERQLAGEGIDNSTYRASALRERRLPRLFPSPTVVPAVWRKPARPGGERRRELTGHARGARTGATALNKRGLSAIVPRGRG